MKYFYYIAFALMIVSCGDDNIVKDAPITLASPGKTLEISRDPAFACDFHETANPVDIIIMQDSFLLLYDAIVENKNNDFYKAYSLDDYSYRGKFGSYGRGPDEFLSPDLSACFKYSGSNICGYIFDVMLCKSFCLDFSRSINEKTVIVDEISTLPDNTIYAFPYRDSLQFVINFENDRMLCHVLDMDGEKIKTFSLYHDGISAEQCLMQLSNCVLVNDDKGLAAMVMLGIPQVNFLDLEDGKVHSTAVDGRYKAWKKILSANTDIKAVMESMQYYCNATSSADYIFALYPKRKMEDLVKPGGPEPHIHIFDWNGKFLYDLSLKENISKIAYDANRKHLYSLDINSGEIYRYDLNGIL